MTPPSGPRPDDPHRWQRYREAIEQVSDGYFVLSRERVFVEVNDRLCAMLGRPRETLLGRSPLEIVTAGSAARMREVFSTIDKTERRSVRYDVVRPDGTIVPVAVRALTYRGADGEVESSLGFVTDVSEIVAAHRQLEDSERELRAILDNMQDTYYRTDLDGRIVRASKSAERLLGFRMDELIGRRLAELYADPADRVAFLAALEASGGSIEQFECRLRRGDGREIWVSTSAHHHRDAAGRVAGVEGTTRDITELRRTREELRLAAQVFGSAAEPIVITDAGLRVVSANPAFEELTGFAAARCVGTSLFDLASGAAARELAAALPAELDARGVWSGEVLARRSDGGSFPSWMSASAVRDEAGRRTHCVVLFSDLTERKATQARMEFLAQHDPLTRLPNRLLFRDRVEQAIARAARSGSAFALLFIDLDSFKAVNDSSGHQIGDQVLRALGERLLAAVRDTDTVSRYGGDEFAIVLTDLAVPEKVAEIAQHLRARVAEPIRIDGREFRVTCTIGVALYPDDGLDCDALLRNADAAMYGGKSAGRDTLRLFTG
jgi:diguanylate cyclase (GGDEF)-like protein/PAS domain S-box-containing protein